MENLLVKFHSLYMSEKTYISNQIVPNNPVRPHISVQPHWSQHVYARKFQFVRLEHEPIGGEKEQGDTTSTKDIGPIKLADITISVIH